MTWVSCPSCPTAKIHPLEIYMWLVGWVNFFRELGVGSWDLGVDFFWLAGFWEFEFGCWELDFGSWELDFGSWKLDIASWNLEVGLWGLVR